MTSNFFEISDSTSVSQKSSKMKNLKISSLRRYNPNEHDCCGGSSKFRNRRAGHVRLDKTSLSTRVSGQRDTGRVSLQIQCWILFRYEQSLLWLSIQHHRLLSTSLHTSWWGQKGNNRCQQANARTSDWGMTLINPNACDI